jgi:hypothetical protein
MNDGEEKEKDKDSAHFLWHAHKDSPNWACLNRKCKGQVFAHALIFCSRNGGISFFF